MNITYIDLINANPEVATLKTFAGLASGNELCFGAVSMESVAPGSRTISFPPQFGVVKQSEAESRRELRGLAATVLAGSEAVIGTYMRMCQLIRTSGLSDDDVRDALGDTFPPTRVSEILRVSRAPEAVYVRYTAGFFGFKAALQQCRLCHMLPEPELRRRKIRRVAERLLALMGGPGQLTIKDRRITVE